MVEYHRNPTTELATSSPLKTCIVGIGGAGGSVLDRITMDRAVDATLVTMHTDIRVLSHSMSPVKIQLGVELMRGVGAGGDPELGREAAMYSREQIRNAIQGHDIIFICVGLGGGTGSGAAPIVAEIAKSTGALVFLTATMPFSFEGKRRLTQAEDSLKQLENRTDALILFENNRMGELTLPKDGIQKAFVQADQLIAQSLRAVSTIITTPGLVKLGLDDLTSALSTSNGRCLFGFGEARGQNRGSEALKRALKSPLIDQGRLLHQTKTLLVHIAGGDSLTLVEVDSIMKQLGKNVPDQTHILFGVAVDPKLGESISVTLISSLGLTQLNTLAAAAPPSEMLPLKERSMPSMLSAVAAKPAPQLKHVPAAEPMDMLFGNDQFSQPEPQAAVVEQPDMFEQESFTSEPEPVVNAEEIPFEEEIFEEVAETEVPEPVSYLAPEPEPEPEPVKPIVRPRIEDFIPNSTARSTTNLTSVVARTPTPKPTPTVEEEAPFAPPLNSVAAKKPLVSTQEEQIAFRFGGDEDRGRFKNTEPALAGGEDLDVPTWMRLKRKLKK